MIGFNDWSWGERMKGFNVVNFQPTVLLPTLQATVAVTFFNFLSDTRPFLTPICLLGRPQKALKRILSHPNLKAFAVTKYLVRLAWSIKCLLALQTNTIRSCTPRWWCDLVIAFILPITGQRTELILSTVRWVESYRACLAYCIGYCGSRHTSILTSMMSTYNRRYDAIWNTC